MGGNCRVCHEQAGPGCTKSTGGEFRLKSARLCQSCHGQEYATKHTAVASDCLSCHDPHCSDSSPFRLRAAVGLKGVDAPSSTAVERSL
ncbi:MAG: hypothetical protein C0617_06220 [Desulfuromonas sp.]|uniref:cytochrome c3 family protein n=1 Tax=Desulfuromonas sp. TaxID=892 RepID=UPI000CB4122C|nr:cytochrome c3 family protein [Desulfuromonas sp.]PLX84936.1 MAG: hypothetical protein C0617_06220 [Desulfuromonas sp.]